MIPKKFLQRVAALATLTLLVAAAGCYEKNGAKLDAEQFSRVCVIMNSCVDEWGQDMEGTMGMCSEMVQMLTALGYTNLTPEVYNCIDSAGSNCGTAYACTNEGHRPESCDAVTFTERCEGTLHVTCEDGFMRYVDCASMRDLLGTSFEFTCGTDGCQGPVCEGEFERCNGDLLEACADGRLEIEDICGWYGDVTCTEADGDVWCIGQGPSCSEGSNPRCEGTVLVDCVGGKESRYDCSAMGDFTCRSAGEDADADCVVSGTECNPSYDPDSCQGSVIRYCQNGTWATFDCKSLGYSTCRTVQGEGLTGAVCE